MMLLGEIILEATNLSRDKLERCLDIQKEKGGRLGEIMLRKKYISESDLMLSLSIQLGMLFLKTLPQVFDTSFTEKVPIQFLKKHIMVPIVTGESSHIAVNDPMMFQPIDDLNQLLGLYNATPVLATRSTILAAINLAFDSSREGSAEQVIQDMRDDDPESIISEINDRGDLLDDTSAAPIIKFVNLMLSQAVKAEASDIHIEPYQNGLKIRQRVDGILYDMFSPPSRVHASLVSRIKIMANLNIAEKRLPQDGRTEIKIADKNVDVRVSTLPTAYGERVVLRLLDKSSVILTLTDLGMTTERLAIFNRLIKASHGIILVTGPTGSGKTTTLYGALSSINNMDINIITIEDPIEYRMNGIGQVQVNPKIDLTFANGLRSIVRQDPDVILIGEIRDLETAEIAIQSALTGHLVFSTLHTNDAASSVTRLIDMGIEPFLITSSVNAILAQRLVRVLCQSCRVEYEPEEETLLNINMTSEMLNGKKIWHNIGCSDCHETGYSGRNGIFELMLFDDSIKAIILKTSDANALKRKAIQNGMITLREDGARKVLEGITTVEEVFRVTDQ